MKNWQMVVTTTLTLATILIGVWQFSVDSQKRADNAAFEAKKPFLVRQMDLCIESTNTVAILASNTNIEMWNKARNRFWELYWGPLSVVETPFHGNTGLVEKQMKTIGDLLKPTQNNPSLPMDFLEQPALELSHRCRKLIFESWNIKTGD